MNRRQFTKRAAFTAGAIGLGGPLVISQEGCKEAKSLAKWAGLVGDIIAQMSPILDEMGASGVVALVTRALPIIASLKKAFEENATSTGLELFKNLTDPQTGIIVQLATALGGLQGQKRILLLGLLASAQVILRTIAANIQIVAPLQAGALAATVNAGAVQTDAIEKAFAASRF